MQASISPPPRFYITEGSNEIVLLWFSVACFWCQSFGRFILRVFISILVRFGLLSDHLLGAAHSD